MSNLFTSFVIMSFFIFYTSNWFTYLLVYFVILSFLYSKLVHFFIILSLIGWVLRLRTSCAKGKHQWC